MAHYVDGILQLHDQPPIDPPPQLGDIWVRAADQRQFRYTQVYSTLNPDQLIGNRWLPIDHIKEDTKSDQGAQGLKGIRGPVGEEGVPGGRGATGPDGVKGATGPEGATGVEGATGFLGQRGISYAQKYEKTPDPYFSGKFNRGDVLIIDGTNEIYIATGL